MLQINVVKPFYLLLAFLLFMQPIFLSQGNRVYAETRVSEFANLMYPFGLAYDENENQIYVAQEFTSLESEDKGRISAISLSTNEMNPVVSFDFVAEAMGVAVNSRGDLYFALYNDTYSNKIYRVKKEDLPLTGEHMITSENISEVTDLVVSWYTTK